MTAAEKVDHLRRLLAQAIEWNWIDLNDEIFEMGEEAVFEYMPDLVLLRNEIFDEIGGVK